MNNYKNFLALLVQLSFGFTNVPAADTVYPDNYPIPEGVRTEVLNSIKALQDLEAESQKFYKKVLPNVLLHLRNNRMVIENAGEPQNSINSEALQQINTILNKYKELCETVLDQHMMNADVYRYLQTALKIIINDSLQEFIENLKILFVDTALKDFDLSEKVLDDFNENLDDKDFSINGAANLYPYNNISMFGKIKKFFTNIPNALGRNQHKILKDLALRSGGLDNDRLASYVIGNDIKTIINVRGINYQKDWFERLNTLNNINVYHIAIDHHATTNAATLLRLMLILDCAEYPIRFMDKSGTNRTGEASAFFLKMKAGFSTKTALDQLSTLFGDYFSFLHPFKKVPAQTVNSRNDLFTYNHETSEGAHINTLPGIIKYLFWSCCGCRRLNNYVDEGDIN